MYKLFVLAAVMAVANAGLLAAPAITSYAAPSVAAIGQNTYRSYGNLGQVSTYSKALDTPYSSVRKTDVRVSNDALAYGGYAAPAYAAATYAAPAVQTYAAPAVAKVAGLGVAYSPASVVSTMSFNGYGINYGW